MLYFINIGALGERCVLGSREGFVAKSQHEMPAPGAAGEQGLWILADLASSLVSLQDTKTLQEEVLDHALQMFDCGCGTICLWDRDGGRVRLGATTGTVVGLHPEEVLAAPRVATEVLAGHKPLILPEGGKTIGIGPAAWSGMAIIPICGSETVLGLILLGDLEDDRQFTSADAALMAALGGVAASAMETHLEFDEFRREMSGRMAEAMTELTHTAAQLQRLKTFSEELFDSAPVGIIIFDRDLRITFRNSAAERLWPEDKSVTAGAKRTDVASRDHEWEAGLRDVIRMQRPWMAEGVTFARSGREPTRVTLTASPLFNASGSVIGGVMIVEDVTYRTQMEQRLAVSERLAGVGRLASMVAHEINNPLDGIIRLVNLARRVSGEEKGDPRIEKYLADADKGLARMVAIVRDLLAFSRTAAGTVDPKPIAEILGEITEAMVPLAEKSKVVIEMDCASDVPPLRSGILHQVVLNLIKNAIEAMPKGGRVDVRARRLPDAVILEVADTGPGIPPEAMSKLFEPFYSLKPAGHGTGLGLVICKDLMEKQGGTILAANRPEGGAVFTVRIPLAPSAAKAKP
jgi:PAS domain S-box-containing protein